MKYQGQATLSISICFKCGAQKANPFDGCAACGASPVGDHDRAVSLVLSDRRSTRAQLETYAGDVRRYGYPIIDAGVLEQAKEVLKRSATKASAEREQVTQVAAGVPTNRVISNIDWDVDALMMPETKIRKDAPEWTRLHLNPFHVLGATTRDPARRIIELAEERALVLDPAQCSKARSDLLAPRARLDIEMAWMPGVAPQRANALLQSLRSDIDALKRDSAIPALANANLMAAAFEILDPAMEAEAWADWIAAFAQTLDAIEPEAVLRDINEDRAVAGFTEVKQLEAIEEELSERRRYYKDAIKATLNSLPSEKLVETLTILVSAATSDGETQAPLLIDDVIDTYQAEADSHLQERADQIQNLIKDAKAAAPKGAAAVKPFVERLDGVLRGWNKVAKPIQVSLKARGRDHDLSRNLAYQVRSLGIELFNKHDMVDLVREFTGKLGNIFADLPELKQQLQDDGKAIQNVIKGREEQQRNNEEWAREITYEAEVGLIFKDTLKISAVGLQWREKTYPLESVTRVRWGGINHSVNGIPSGSTYTIAFGDDRSESRIELKRSTTYQNFVDRLWKAVCTRLMYEMLVALKAGRRMSFGDGVLDDAGLHLTKHKFLGSEQVYVKWNDTHVWSHDGSFFIGAKADKKAYASMSYINVTNAHICEAVIRAAFKKGAIPLSTLLNG